MKKQFLLLLGLILTSFFLNAQEREAGTIELTPNIGYSNSYLNGDETDDLDPRGGIQFGLIGDYYISDRWSVRSGLSYFSMGASVPGSELKLDYLNIPINANWHFGSTRKWNLNFGVTPGFLLSADLDGEDVKDFYKSFQLGISYGIGYKIEISESFSVLVDLEGLFGITNILDNSDLNRLNSGGSINVGGVFTL